MSGLVRLGLTLILFVITFGVSFILMPIIMGSFFDQIDSNSIVNEEWKAMYEQNENTVLYLVPLMPSFGIVIIVLKIMLNASARGND